MFHCLDHNPNLIIELICDITKVLDKIWYEQNLVRFQGKQVDPH